VAEGLSEKNINPAKITIICANRYFRPFAFAYFNNAEPGNWHAAVLKILAWTQDNTYIQTSYEHKLPIESFAEFRDEDNVVDESVLPDAPDSVDTPEETEASLETFTTPQHTPDSVDTPEETEASLETSTTPQPVNRDRQQIRTDGDNLLATPQNSESQQVVSVPNPVREERITNRSILPVVPADLLYKLQNTGAPLGYHWNIHAGINLRCVKAFIIDERKREYLIREDANSSKIIAPIARRLKKKKWELEAAYLIWISSSLHKQWPWSYMEDESEAEQIFAQTYPAISRHLIDYKDILKSRGAGSKAKYYWELSSRELKRENYPEFYQPKIVYPISGSAMQAAYSTWYAACIPNTSYCIPTDDLSLLAILNSKLFDWYARAQFRNSTGGSNLFFTKKNMEKSPIAFRSENQKMELSYIVNLILSNPNIPEIPDIEKEIDALVYELYKLTDAEIALIEKGINP
ncbi:hypothetical protein C6503_10620, partial [Candidatus Poribacteria bacterium]